MRINGSAFVSSGVKSKDIEKWQLTETSLQVNAVTSLTGTESATEALKVAFRNTMQLISVLSARLQNVLKIKFAGQLNGSVTANNH